jgi:hypothetical protein
MEIIKPSYILAERNNLIITRPRYPNDTMSPNCHFTNVLCDDDVIVEGGYCSDTSYPCSEADTTATEDFNPVTAGDPHQDPEGFLQEDIGQHPCSIRIELFHTLSVMRMKRSDPTVDPVNTERKWVPSARELHAMQVRTKGFHTTEQYEEFVAKLEMVQTARDRLSRELYREGRLISTLEPMETQKLRRYTVILGLVLLYTVVIFTWYVSANHGHCTRHRPTWESIFDDVFFSE